MFEGVKWLFFDVGSTLMDESLAYEHRMRDMAELAGQPFEQVWQTAMDFYHRCRKGDLETARQLGVEVPRWHKEDERPYPGALDCLAQLSRQYRIGIIANQSPGTAQRLEQHGMLQYTELVISSAEEGVSKPDPRIFTLALERAGCAPQEAAMIGDRIDNDVVPAKRLGMRTIRVQQGLGRFCEPTCDEERADCTVSSIAEVCGALEEGAEA